VAPRAASSSTSAPALAPSEPAASTNASVVPDVIPALGPAEPDDNPYGPGFEPARPGHYLLAIDPHERPYTVNVPRDYGPYFPIVSLIRVCVSKTGTVANVEILQPTIPVVDLQIPNVIPRWRYHPYVYKGQPVSWCYRLRYNIVGPHDPNDVDPLDEQDFDASTLADDPSATSASRRP
jgi:hypothetical protein